MEFTVSNRNDIDKYYRHTFVKIREPGSAVELSPDTLYFIESVDGQKVSGKCENGDCFVIWLSDTHPFEADYVLPHKSFFQHGNKACLLERIPAQQYYRGLNGENTKVSYLYGASATPKALSIDFKVLKDYVTKKKFFTLQEAQNAQGNDTCALSPRMQYHRTLRQIYVDHMPVARVDQGHLVVMLHNIFKEEVEGLLYSNGESEKFEFYIPKKEQLLKEKEVSL